jgi:hypothetical protein
VAQPVVGIGINIEALGEPPAGQAEFRIGIESGRLIASCPQSP